MSIAKLLPLALALSACVTAVPPSVHDLDGLAREYVLLTLALGVHDADFVDAYHGPEEWRREAQRNDWSLADISIKAALARRGLAAGNFGGDSSLVTKRRALLDKQLLAVQTRADQLRGQKLSFDEEARLLYDARPPRFGREVFEDLLAELDAMLPGTGSVSMRRERFREDFVIAPQQLDAVFSAAIEECRRRTVAHIALPAGERFVVEYVTDKPWSGYNWFQGDAYSLIQVNTDLPIHIDRAVDLACHEGYPGHHVFNTLLERELLEERGWMEFSVYALFSPMSLIAEGSANFGIDMAFPGEQRIAYERDVLFPLAGLDPSRVEEYYAVEKIADKLTYAGNEAARRYLDGEMTREQAAAWLETYALMSPERAKQRVAFIDKYRAYVINYNLGQDIVRAAVDRVPADERWATFERLLSTPVSASMLTE